MPRYPHFAANAAGFSADVFGVLPIGRTEHVYALHVGDTYLEPLAEAQAEAQRTAEHARLHNYAPVQGEPELLDAIQRKLARRSGVTPAREDIQVMSGATAAMGVIANALLMPG